MVDKAKRIHRLTRNTDTTENNRQKGLKKINGEPGGKRFSPILRLSDSPFLLLALQGIDFTGQPGDLPGTGISVVDSFCAGFLDHRDHFCQSFLSSFNIFPFNSFSQFFDGGLHRTPDMKVSKAPLFVLLRSLKSRLMNCQGILSFLVVNCFF